jgi:cell shape-determining protein MreC
MLLSMTKLNPSRPRSLLIIAAFIGAAILIMTPAGRAITSPVRALARPMAGAVSGWALAWRSAREDADALRRERDALRGEVLRMSARLRDDAVCTEELRALQALAHYAAGKGFRTVAARVVARASSDGGRLIIDQGTRAGITQGAAVIAGERILVGRVAAVDEEFSEIALLADPSINISARIAGKPAEGVVRADAEGALVLDFVAADTAVVAADQVLTNGLDERVPQDLIIGTVARVEKIQTSPFLRIQISPVPADAFPRMVYAVLPVRP